MDEMLDDVLAGIKFAISRMGLQFTSEQQENLSSKLMDEYLRNKMKLCSFQFKTFPKIKSVGNTFMSITEKIHGTNAQIFITGEIILAGSRTRWLTPEDDNHGFARWVFTNREELIAKLGDGRHYGEWFGQGINSGYNLKKKMLALFNHHRWIGKDLPEGITTVPELYRGALSMDIIHGIMDNLKVGGSRIIPGYMQPEGIVIEVDGNLYKKVFDAEETKWTGKVNKPKGLKPSIDISHLYQSIRLEKILSSDERFVMEYPNTLGDICKLYINDLIAEGQLSSDEDEAKKERKALSKSVFCFIKAAITAKG